jgi:hypothetical protein
VPIGAYQTGGRAVAIAASASFVFVADDAVGLHVIDLGNPAKPERVGIWYMDHPNKLDEPALAVWGHYVLLGSEDLGMVVLDVADPSTPSRVGGYGAGGGAGLAVSGNYAYVAAGRSGLQVLAITELPAFTRQSVLDANVGLSWNEAATGMTLQRTPSLTAPDWQIVAGAEMTNYVALPLSGASAFFRLVKP